jgi:hypothetical protein
LPSSRRRRRHRGARHSGFLGGFNGLMNVPPLTYTLHGEPVGC